MPVNETYQTVDKIASKKNQPQLNSTFIPLINLESDDPSKLPVNKPIVTKNLLKSRMKIESLINKNEPKTKTQIRGDLKKELEYVFMCETDRPTHDQMTELARKNKLTFDQVKVCAVSINLIFFLIM